MAISVTEWDKIVCGEIEKEFPDKDSLPEGYDKVLWTGFKESMQNADVGGQILLRPSDWQSRPTKKPWIYSSIYTYCQDVGGVMFKGMIFPEFRRGSSTSNPFPAWPEFTEKLVTEKSQTAIRRLRDIAGEQGTQSKDAEGITLRDFDAIVLEELKSLEVFIWEGFREVRGTIDYEGILRMSPDSYLHPRCLKIIMLGTDGFWNAGKSAIREPIQRAVRQAISLLQTGEEVPKEVAVSW